MRTRGLTTFLWSLVAIPFGVAANDASLVLTNASIYQHAGADSIAISDGRIVAVDTLDKIESLIGSRTKTIDVEGAHVLPGFIDNHNHVFEAASGLGGSCELSPDASLEDQIPFLEDCKREDSNDGWLMGYGFSIESILSSDSERTPLEVLDEVFPMRPVVIMEQTSHSMWVNSAALAEVGITNQTPHPQGGQLLHDEESGLLNGILLDNAGDIVMEHAWNSHSELFERSYEGLLAGLEEAAAHGITTIGDGRMYWQRGWYEVWMHAQEQEALTARVSLRPWIYPAQDMQRQLDYLKTIYSNDHSQLLLVEQVKLYSDGIIINGTAKTLVPYLDTYLANKPYGLNYIPPNQMKLWLQALAGIGYGAHVHAIGDGAVRESLDAIEQARNQKIEKDYTLTHIELVDKEDVSRFAQLGVTADFQVGSDYVAMHDHQWAQWLLGAMRSKALMNVKAMHDSGANVTLSSDWNVHSINPLVGIANSLKMAETGLPNIHAAIEAYTNNAAKSLGIDDLTGSLAVGKSADIVILSEDITQLPVDKIAQTDVLMTILHGHVVFSAE